MASIGTLFPATSSSTASSTSSPATPVASDPLANQSTFLQLLVAQLKNQDPSTPMDGTTFVTQLAQFSDLEQNLGTRQDLDAIAKQYTGATPSTPATTPASTSTDTSSTGSTSGA